MHPNVLEYPSLWVSKCCMAKCKASDQAFHPMGVYNIPATRYNQPKTIPLA